MSSFLSDMCFKMMSWKYILLLVTDPVYKMLQSYDLFTNFFDTFCQMQEQLHVVLLIFYSVQFATKMLLDQKNKLELIKSVIFLCVLGQYKLGNILYHADVTFGPGVPALS